jgi:methylmalonyl-CoA/ethylmalonyl-CoA epimerase
MNAASIAEVLARLPASLKPLSTGLDHIGLAVESLESSLPLYRDLLGLPLLYTETVESDGVRVAVLELGGVHLELLEPTGEDTPVGRFLAKRGSGIHHVALRVNDCATALAALRDAGYRLLDETPRPGAGGKQIGFVHPRSTGGLLLELCQPG